MQIIEDVSQYEWWPYPAVDLSSWRPEWPEWPTLSSLWLAVNPDEEPELLARLATAWAGLEWLVMNTWGRKQRDLPAQGFTERYPGFAREIIARSDTESPRGFVWHAEWCVADPSSRHLHEVLSAIRMSRGSGGCLTLGSSSPSRGTWYALSTAMSWRSAFPFEFKGAGYARIQDTIAGAYLHSIAAANLIAMVPLDYHPLGGYALLGSSEQLSVIAGMLPPDMSSFSALSVAELWALGGGLAL